MACGDPPKVLPTLAEMQALLNCGKSQGFGVLRKNFRIPLEALEPVFRVADVEVGLEHGPVSVFHPEDNTVPIPVGYRWKTTKISPAASLTGLSASMMIFDDLEDEETKLRAQIEAVITKPLAGQTSQIASADPFGPGITSQKPSPKPAEAWLRCERRFLASDHPVARLPPSTDAVPRYSISCKGFGRFGNSETDKAFSDEMIAEAERMLRAGDLYGTHAEMAPDGKSVGIVPMGGHPMQEGIYNDPALVLQQSGRERLRSVAGEIVVARAAVEKAEEIEAARKVAKRVDEVLDDLVHARVTPGQVEQLKNAAERLQREAALRRAVRRG
jgi:hypothetical protein